MRLKIGSKFTWMTQEHHVLGFVEDSGEQLIVAKYWRGSSWGFEVIPVSRYQAHQAKERAARRRPAGP